MLDFNDKKYRDGRFVRIYYILWISIPSIRLDLAWHISIAGEYTRATTSLATLYTRHLAGGHRRVLFWALYLSLFLSRCLRAVDPLPRKRLAGFEKTIHRGSSPSPLLPAFYFTALGANCRRAARAALRAARLRAMNYYCLVPHAASRYAGSLSRARPRKAQIAKNNIALCMAREKITGWALRWRRRRRRRLLLVQSVGYRRVSRKELRCTTY